MAGLQIFPPQIKHFFRSQFNQTMLSINGHKEYTRFVILARSRTGSNLLRSALNEHSQAKVYSELFRNPADIDWGFPDHHSQAALSLYQKDPAEFLQTRIYGKYPRNIKAVGFKLFYYHASFGSGERLWDYLCENKGIKIIHLKRKNILATHLSRKKADITGAWANISGKPEEQAQFTLSYDECLQDFTRTRSWELEYDRFFQEHPILEVVYENLSSNYLNEIKRVQAFLNLPEENVIPKTQKQASLPLSEAIYNFPELKEKFLDSPWEEFFTDD
jgi:LPS sulfotransferase NodH